MGQSKDSLDILEEPLGHLSPALLAHFAHLVCTDLAEVQGLGR